MSTNDIEDFYQTSSLDDLGEAAAVADGKVAGEHDSISTSLGGLFDRTGAGSVFASFLGQKKAAPGDYDGSEDWNARAEKENLRDTTYGPNNFEVVVGNVGSVYMGNDQAEAERVYEQYVWQSQTNAGRESGESVILFIDGEIDSEYDPTSPDGQFSSSDMMMAAEESDNRIQVIAKIKRRKAKQDHDAPCEGGCGKVRSVTHSDSPKGWLCYDCGVGKKKTLPKQGSQAWKVLKAAVQVLRKSAGHKKAVAVLASHGLQWDAKSGRPVQAVKMNIENPEQALQDNPDKYLVHVMGVALEALSGEKHQQGGTKAAEAALSKLLAEGGFQNPQFTALGYDDISVIVDDQETAARMADFLNTKLQRSTDPQGYGYMTTWPAQAVSYTQLSDAEEGDEYSSPGDWVHPARDL